MQISSLKKKYTLDGNEEKDDLKTDVKGFR
jgi:hypothetical protein